LVCDWSAEGLKKYYDEKVVRPLDLMGCRQFTNPALCTGGQALERRRDQC